MEFALSAGFWLLKKVFQWFGANEEKIKWLQKTADRLHEKGWMREKLILELDEQQNNNLEKSVREKMKKKAQEKEGQQ